MTKFDLFVIDHYQPDNDNNSQGHLAYHSGLNPHWSKASALGIWFLNRMWRLVDQSVAVEKEGRISDTVTVYLTQRNWNTLFIYLFIYLFISKYYFFVFFPSSFLFACLLIFFLSSFILACFVLPCTTDLNSMEFAFFYLFIFFFYLANDVLMRGGNL